ncbi:hypothetical protein F5Y15DRAFT_411883 [Xylariaceae sp. FL0016]|nr:hypothetical protein F5Y15DRAFT_411883 [Xylariaceae sp. FL0016]
MFCPGAFNLPLLFWLWKPAFAFHDTSFVEARLVATTSISRQDSLNHDRKTIAWDPIEVRAITTELSTCGYVDGNPTKSRTADSGYNCRIDISTGLWGFCPTTVSSASDCGLAGACFDNQGCSDGCGKLGTSGLTTFTCSGSDMPYCSTVLLEEGVDQTFSYIACGRESRVDTLLASPTKETTTSKSTSTASATESAKVASQSVSGSSTLATSTQDSATSSAASASNGQTTTNTGAIVGGVIGGLALICGTVVAVVYLMRRGRRKRQESQEGWNSGHQPESDKQLHAQGATPAAWDDRQAHGGIYQTQPAEMYAGPVQQPAELAGS